MNDLTKEEITLLLNALNSYKQDVKDTGDLCTRGYLEWRDGEVAAIDALKDKLDMGDGTEAQQ